MLGLVLVIALGQVSLGTVVGLEEANAGGNIQGLANILFSRYVFAFEATSALLITAAIGAMVLAHRERLHAQGRARPRSPPSGCSDYAESGKHPGPLPSPGVYARHNAVDTPALLPDGTASEISVSRVLASRGTVRSAPALADDIEGVQEQLGGVSTADGGGRRTGKAGSTASHRGGRRPVNEYIVLSAILFTIGCVGVLVRRNAIVVFMCVELMLNACNLALVAFAKQHGNLDGQIAAFFVMVVAAAEVVVGLAIIMTIFRTRRSASVDDASLLKY